MANDPLVGLTLATPKQQAQPGPKAVITPYDKYMADMEAESVRRQNFYRSQYWAPAARYTGLAQKYQQQQAEEDKGWLPTILDNIWTDNVQEGFIPRDATVFGMSVPGAEYTHDRWAGTTGAAIGAVSSGYQWVVDHRNQILTETMSALPGGTQTTTWERAGQITPGRMWVAMGLDQTQTYQQYLERQSVIKKEYDKRVARGDLTFNMDETPAVGSSRAPIFAPKGFDIRNPADEKWLFGDPENPDAAASPQAEVANLRSGAVDFAASWFLDPLVVVGKGAKVFRFGSEMLDIVGQTTRSSNQAKAVAQAERELDDFLLYHESGGTQGRIRGVGKDAQNFARRTASQLENEKWAQGPEAGPILALADMTTNERDAAVIFGAALGSGKYIDLLHKEQIAVADALTSLKSPNPYEMVGANSPIGANRPPILRDLLESNVTGGGLLTDMIARDESLRRALDVMAEVDSPIQNFSGARFGNTLSQAWRAGKTERDQVAPLLGGRRGAQHGPEGRPSTDTFNEGVALSEAEKVSQARNLAAVGSPVFRVVDKETGKVTEEMAPVYHGTATPITNDLLFPTHMGFSTTESAVQARAHAGGPAGTVYNVGWKGKTAPLIADDAALSSGTRAAAQRIVGTKLPAGLQIEGETVARGAESSFGEGQWHRMTARDAKGGYIGQILWDEKGTIQQIEVNGAHQRQGIATAMWHQAKQYAADNGIAAPEDFTQIAGDAKKWATSMKRGKGAPAANNFPRLTKALQSKRTTVSALLRVARDEMEASGMDIPTIEKNMASLGRALKKDGYDAVRHVRGNQSTITWLNTRNLRIEANATAGMDVRTGEQILQDEILPMVRAFTPGRLPAIDPVSSSPAVFEQVFQLSKNFRKVAVWEWINGQRGSGWLVVRGADDGLASEEWKASLRDSPALRGDAGFVDALISKWRHGTEEENLRLAAELEEEAAVQIARHYGLRYVDKATGEVDAHLETLARAIYANLKKKRTGALETFTSSKGRAYGVDPETGKLITVGPLLRSQLDTRIPLIDFKLLDKVMRELAQPAMKPYLQEIEDLLLHQVGVDTVGYHRMMGKFSENATWVLEGLNSAWKAAVLMRLGYTQRNVFEGWLRTWAVLGMVPALSPKNVVTGTGRVLWMNRRRARDMEMIDTKAKILSNTIATYRHNQGTVLDDIAELQARTIPAPNDLEVGLSRSTLSRQHGPLADGEPAPKWTAERADGSTVTLNNPVAHDELPDFVYYVTTKTDDVAKSGAIRMNSGRPLVVTTSREHATKIRDGLRGANAGDVNIIAIPRKNIPKDVVIDHTGQPNMVAVHGDLPIGRAQLSDVKNRVIYDEAMSQAQAEAARYQRDLDGYAVQMHDFEVARRGTRKRFIGDEEAFAGAAGDIHRANASNEEHIKNFFESKAARDAQMSRMDEQTYQLTNPDAPEYFDELSNAAIQLRHDPLGQIALRMDGGDGSVESMMAWFETDAGKAYTSDMRLFSRKDRVGRATVIHDEVANYFPNMEAMALAGREAPPIGYEFRAVLGGLKDLSPIHGRKIVENTESIDPYHRFINGVFRWLGSKPDSALVRQPFYNEVWMRETSSLYQKAIANGRDVTDPAVYKAIENTAHRRALKATTDTLFTITRYSNPAAVLRFISPFFAAWENSIRTWSRIIVRDPSVAARAAILWNLPNKMGMVVDQNGDPVKDGMGDFLSGSLSQYVVVPKFIDDFYQGAAKKVSEIPMFKDTLIGDIAVGAMQFPLKIPKGSFNVVAPGESPFLPGLGPVVTSPVGFYLSNKPDQQEIVHDFLGDALYSQIAPFGQASGNILDTVAPASVRKAITGWQGEGNADYLATLDALTVDAIITWQLSGGHPGDRPDPEAIKQATDDFYKFSTVASLTLPVSITRMSQYQPIMDAWRKMSENTTMTYRDKVASFLDLHGDAYLMFTRSTSKSDINGLDPSMEMWQVMKDHEREVQILTNEAGPGGAGLLAATVPEGQFNAGVYQYWSETRQPGTDSPYKSRMTANELLVEDRVARMWQEYTAEKTMRDAAMEKLGLSTWDSKAAQEAGITQGWNDFQSRMFSKYKEDYTIWGPQAYVKSLPQTLGGLTKMVRDEKFMSSPLGQSAVWGSIKEYMDQREKAYEAIRNGADKDTVKTMWAQFTAAHKYSSLKFSDFFDTYLENDDLTVRVEG